MVTRYCGNVRIKMKLVPAPGMPHGEQYRCLLSRVDTGRRLGTIYVGLPATLSHAIDSPSAYHEAARAALSFALDEEERGERDWGGVGELAESDEHGWLVRIGRYEKPYRRSHV